MNNFVVAVPLDRTDERDSQAPVSAKKKRGRPRKSQMERWTDFVMWCESESKKRSRTVAVHFWGTSEIISRLSQAEHAGRRTFWFDAPDLGLDLLGQKLVAAKMIAGKRYTPETNTEVSITHQMRALRFDDEIIKGIQERVQVVASKVVDLSRPPKSSQKEIIDRVRDATSFLEEKACNLTISNSAVTIEEIDQHLKEISTSVGEMYDLISDEAKAAKNKAKEREVYDYVKHKCDQVYTATSTALKWIDNVVVALLKGKPLLLVGDAGKGKTHLFIDQCQAHLSSGGGAIVLFGQKVQSDRAVAKIISSELELGDLSVCDLLGVLNSFGQASSRPFLVLIDALNESPLRDTIWNHYMPDFLLAMRDYPYVRMATSVRNDFLRLTLSQQLIDSFVRMSHPGFEGVEYEAVKAYFRHYEIDLTTPPLNPEFSNPLFLKIYCEARHRAGNKLSPDGLDGLYLIFDMLINEINQKISRDLKMQSNRKLVQTALKKLAAKMGSRSFLLEADAIEVVESLFKGVNDEQSLYYSMLSEGLLVQTVGYSETGTADQTNIALAYDRFTDLIKAMSIIPDELSDENRTALRTQLEALILNDHEFYQNQSLLSALSLVLPERFIGEELIDVLSPSHDKVDCLIGSFLYSVIWRTSESMSDRTVELWWKIQENQKLDTVFDDLLLMALRKDHTLNALALDDLLRLQSMHNRDIGWSNSVDRLWGGFVEVDGYELRAIHRLVDWALRHPDPGRISDDVRFLWAIALSWIFSTSNRIARDFATKALVRLLENRLVVAEKLCRHFASSEKSGRVNDPYVVERVMCASYGAAMRSQDQKGLERLAQLGYDLFFAPNSQCDHVLIRDYALGLIRLALDRAIPLSIDPTRIEPPFETVGFDPHLTTDAIKKKYNIEDRKWNEGYTPAWNKLKPEHIVGGDFGIYQVSSTLTRFGDHGRDEESGHDLHDLVGPWMLECMIDLGWAPDFEESANRVNHHCSYSRHDQEKPESLTKKYAWIALHRAEGIMSDHYRIKDGWGKDAEWRYRQGPWEGYRRDIDPSFIPLEQTKGSDSGGTHQWFPAGSVMPDWRPEVDDETWMSDSNNLPVLDIILPWTLADGTEYLMLQSFKTEKQPVSPLAADGKPTRDSYLFVWSYFVPRAMADKAYDWLKEQNYSNKWMPESGSSSQVFIGEIPWHPASDRGSELRLPIPTDSNYFSFRQELPPPCDLLISTDEYSWGSGYDTTCKTDFSFLMPCYQLIESLGLIRHGELPQELKIPISSFGFQEAAWFDKEGRCVAFAPDVYRPGPSAIFISREALLEFLKKEDLALCWTFLGGRCSYVRDMGAEPPGKAIIINGAGILTIDDNLSLGELTLSET
jgi:hypothetical protein